jgi:hypothetical protein
MNEDAKLVEAFNRMKAAEGLGSQSLGSMSGFSNQMAQPTFPEEGTQE